MKDIPNNNVYIPKWQITYIKDHLKQMRDHMHIVESSIEYLEKHVVKVAESFFEGED